MRIKQLLVYGIIATVLGAGVLGTALPTTVFADASTDAAKAVACEGAGGKMEDGKCVTPGPSLDGIIANVINILSIVVGITAVIMIMVAGFKYITSGGESSGISGAKNTIIYAVIGLVIVAFAQIIVKFVVKTTTVEEPKEETSLIIYQA